MSKKIKSDSLILINILLLVILAQVGVDFYLPAFPRMKVDLVTSGANIQFTLTVYMLAFGLGQILLCPLSDEYGRKPALKWAFVFFIVGSFVAGLAQSITVLLMARFIEGIGSSMFEGISRAIAHDRFKGKKLASVFSYMSVVWAIVPILAPVLGGYILRWTSWPVVFYMVASLAVVIAIFLFRTLPETNQDLEKVRYKKMFKDCRTLLKHKAFFAFTIVCVIQTSIFISFNMVSPFLFQTTLGLSPVDYAWVLLVISLGYLIGAAINTFLLRYLESITIFYIGLVGGLIVLIIGYLISILLQMTVLNLAVPVFMFQLMSGLIYPNAITAALGSFNKQLGLISSVFGTAMYSGSTILTFPLVYLPDVNQIPLMSVVLIQLLLSILAVIRYRWTDGQK